MGDRTNEGGRVVRLYFNPLVNPHLAGRADHVCRRHLLAHRPPLPRRRAKRGSRSRRRWRRNEMASASCCFLTAASPAFAVQPDEILTDPALEAARPGALRRACAVSSARISRSTIPMRRWPGTCAFSSASTSRRARPMPQMIDFVVARYGDFVLLKPRFTAKTALLWATPFAVCCWLPQCSCFAAGRERPPMRSRFRPKSAPPCDRGDASRPQHYQIFICPKCCRKPVLLYLVHRIPSMEVSHDAHRCHPQVPPSAQSPCRRPSHGDGLIGNHGRVPPAPVHAQTQAAIDPTKGFAELVDRVMPAVVSVQVKFANAAAPQVEGQDLPGFGDLPEDSPFRDFLSRSGNFATDNPLTCRGAATATRRVPASSSPPTAMR